MLRPAPLRLCQRGAAPAGCPAPSRSDPCPSSARRRGVGLSLSRQRQSPSATAARKAVHGHPGQQLEGPSTAVQTLSPPGGPRQTGAPGRRRECACTPRMYVGHGQTGPCDPSRPADGAPVAHSLRRFVRAIGRGAAPVCCRPRRREEAARNPRASSEAGPRRRPGRWEPPHGEQQEQPSPMTGSGSSDRHRHHKDSTMKTT
jgi:hypothetical protein